MLRAFGSFFESSSPKVSILHSLMFPLIIVIQVDTALQNFRNAQATEDVEAFHAISSDIVERIRELEDFSLLHRFSRHLLSFVFSFACAFSSPLDSRSCSTDDRVCLFEKQRSTPFFSFTFGTVSLVSRMTHLRSCIFCHSKSSAAGSSGT